MQSAKDSEQLREEVAARTVLYWQRVLARHSEYYRKNGLADAVANSADPLDIIAATPITTKAQVLEHLDELLLKARSKYAPYEWNDADVEPAPASEANMMEVNEAGGEEHAFLREWMPVHFQMSGGTTGQAVMTAYTWRDIHKNFQNSARYLYRVTGIEPRDVVMNVCPAAPHLGIYATLILPILIGQPNFNTFGGKITPTNTQVALASQLKANALVGITSYIGQWARLAAASVKEKATDPLSSLRTVVCVGEPVNSAFRARLEDLFSDAGAPNVRVVEGMSSTEMRSAGFYQCAPTSGLHVDDAQFYVEVVDPQTHEAVPDGTPGVLVWSHIDWRGHAIARYWSGDVVHGGLERGKCSHCGELGSRLMGPLTRHDRDFVKVRGARIEILSLFDAISAVDGVDTYQITLDSEDPTDPTSRDRLKILVGTDTPSEELRAALVGRVQTQTEVRPDEVTFRSVDEVERRLFQRRLKAERLIDER